MNKCLICGREFEPFRLRIFGPNKLGDMVCLLCINTFNLILQDTYRTFWLKMVSYGADYGLEKPTIYHP